MITLLCAIVTASSMKTFDAVARQVGGRAVAPLVVHAIKDNPDLHAPPFGPSQRMQNGNACEVISLNQHRHHSAVDRLSDDASAILARGEAWREFGRGRLGREC